MKTLTLDPAHEPQGRARHSVRAASRLGTPERRARSDAPYLRKLVQWFQARRSFSGNSLLAHAALLIAMASTAFDAPAESVTVRDDRLLLMKSGVPDKVVTNQFPRL